MPVATAYVSRPSIQIDGQLQTALAATVLSLFVEETMEGLARCEVRLSNYGPRAREPIISILAAICWTSARSWPLNWARRTTRAQFSSARSAL